MAAAAMMATSASASLPSRMWLGVERIGVVCEFQGPMGDAARRELCAALARTAEGMTHYPVTLEPQVPEPGPEADAVLVLRLFVRAQGARPATVEVASRTERHGLTRMTGRQTQYIPVALAWQGDRPTLTGPVSPIAIHLAPLTRNRPTPRG